MGIILYIILCFNSLLNYIGILNWNRNNKTKVKFKKAIKNCNLQKIVKIKAHEDYIITIANFPSGISFLFLWINQLKYSIKYIEPFITLKMPIMVVIEVSPLKAMIFLLCAH